MNLELRIKQLLEEGKNGEEVIEIIAKEFSAVENEVIQKSILAGEKAHELKLASKRKADAEVQAKAVQLQVDAAVDAKLKTINLQPQAKAQYNRKFNMITGKVEEVSEKTTESKKAMSDMLAFLHSGDIKSASAVSAQIEVENRKAANDPTVTDVVARGGYAIPTEVDDMIHALLWGESVMLQKGANLKNVTYNSKIYPLIYGVSMQYIADETTAVTEDQVTFSNPTVDMKRVGAYTNISNEMLRQRVDVSEALAATYASEFAYFLDYHMVAGNITGVSNLLDGIAFDANFLLNASVSAASLVLTDLKSLKNALSAKAKNPIWMGNRAVMDLVGSLENTAGNYAFPQYVSGGSMSPYGIPAVLNAAIPTTFNGAADNLNGTDDLLLCFDPKYFVAGVESTRIDYSAHWRFTNDVTTIRGIKRMGWKVISGTSTAGIVAAGLSINN